jgi:uncharacterized membrane-anchored protein YjiN (DUF445 family)|tara:strand:+ start:817 stop:1050 length:234 start_codon:yes stop_codon:yes gene_type:complete
MRLKWIDTCYIVEEIQNYFKDWEIEDDKEAQAQFIEDLKNFKAGDMARTDWAMRELISKVFADIGHELTDGRPNRDS